MLPPDQIRAALNLIKDPVSGRGLDEAGLVRGLVVSPGRIGFMIEVPADLAGVYGPVRLAAEKKLMSLEGVCKAQVVLTAPSEPAAPRGRAALSGAAVSQNRPQPLQQAELGRPANVGRVLAVGSGKGGVGKSTIGLGLALGFKALGWKTGFLDADIYGPSAPLMLGLTEAPELDNDKRMIPPQAWGLKVNSIGFLIDADQAMIWRGPMASQALNQLLTQTRWGAGDEALDVLVVDLPPGTGDVHLTLSQKTKLDGVAIVSTPQQMALIDARRAVTLFEKLDVPVMGLIENMAGFVAPDGQRIDIFGAGGVADMAKGLNVPMLGSVPLDPQLRQGADCGRPYTASHPDTPMAEGFKVMAQAIITQWAKS